MTGSDARQALTVTGGRIAFVAFSFAGILLVYRGLGTSQEGLAQAGLFAVALACIKIVSGCVSDPIDLATMRSVPGHLATRPDRAAEVLGATLALRLLPVGLLAILGLAAATPIAHLLPDGPDGAMLVRILCVVLLADVVYRASLVVLQAEERFGAFVLAEGVLQLGRFASVLALWLLGAIRVDLVLAAYAAAAILAAALALLRLPAGLLAGLRVRWHDILDLSGYLRWMVPAMVLAALTERLDLLFVFRSAGSEMAGLYGAAVTLALVPDIFAGCLSTFLQPKIARLQSEGRLAATMIRFLRISLPVCGLLFLASLLLSGTLVPLVLGETYARALPAFHWLLGGTLFWLAVTPVPMTALAVLAPRRIAVMTVMQTVIVFAGAFTLLPAIGWIGMAQTVCATRVIVAVTIAISARDIASGATREPLTGAPAAPAMP